MTACQTGNLTQDDQYYCKIDSNTSQGICKLSSIKNFSECGSSKSCFDDSDDINRFGCYKNSGGDGLCVRQKSRNINTGSTSSPAECPSATCKLTSAVLGNTIPETEFYNNDNTPPGIGGYLIGKVATHDGDLYCGYQENGSSAEDGNCSGIVKCPNTNNTNNFCQKLTAANRAQLNSSGWTDKNISSIVCKTNTTNSCGEDLPILLNPGNIQPTVEPNTPLLFNLFEYVNTGRDNAVYQNIKLKTSAPYSNNFEITSTDTNNNTIGLTYLTSLGNSNSIKFPTLTLDGIKWSKQENTSNILEINYNINILNLKNINSTQSGIVLVNSAAKTNIMDSSGFTFTNNPIYSGQTSTGDIELSKSTITIENSVNSKFILNNNSFIVIGGNSIVIGDCVINNHTLATTTNHFPGNTNTNTNTNNNTITMRSLIINDSSNVELGNNINIPSTVTNPFIINNSVVNITAIPSDIRLNSGTLILNDITDLSSSNKLNLDGGTLQYTQLTTSPASGILLGGDGQVNINSLSVLIHNTIAGINNLHIMIDYILLRNLTGNITVENSKQLTIRGNNEEQLSTLLATEIVLKDSAKLKLVPGGGQFMLDFSMITPVTNLSLLICSNTNCNFDTDGIVKIDYNSILELQNVDRDITIMGGVTENYNTTIINPTNTITITLTGKNIITLQGNSKAKYKLNDGADITFIVDNNSIEFVELAGNATITSSASITILKLNSHTLTTNVDKITRIIGSGTIKAKANADAKFPLDLTSPIVSSITLEGYTNLSGNIILNNGIISAPNLTTMSGPLTINSGGEINAPKLTSINGDLTINSGGKINAPKLTSINGILIVKGSNVSVLLPMLTDVSDNNIVIENYTDDCHIKVNVFAGCIKIVGTIFQYTASTFTAPLAKFNFSGYTGGSIQSDNNCGLITEICDGGVNYALCGSNSLSFIGLNNIPNSTKLIYSATHSETTPVHTIDYSVNVNYSITVDGTIVIMDGTANTTTNVSPSPDSGSQIIQRSASIPSTTGFSIIPDFLKLNGQLRIGNILQSSFTEQNIELDYRVKNIIDGYSWVQIVDSTESISIDGETMTIIGQVPDELSVNVSCSFYNNIDDSPNISFRRTSSTGASGSESLNVLNSNNNVIKLPNFGYKINNNSIYKFNLSSLPVGTHIITVSIPSVPVITKNLTLDIKAVPTTTTSAPTTTTSAPTTTTMVVQPFYGGPIPDYKKEPEEPTGISFSNLMNNASTF